MKYSALHYLHSGAAATQEWDSRLLGISLDLPSTHLDAATPFTPPLKKLNPNAPSTSTPFLWQAPNSNAALYTGQKWTELHTLVSHLLDHQTQSSPLPPLLTTKLVSKRHPSWLEHVLQLCRARGYWTLYPSEPTARNLAAVHGELYRAPEEYERELAREPDSEELPVSVAGGTLFESLPEGGLLGFGEMPLLGWDGREVTLGELDAAAGRYAEEFVRAVGGSGGFVL